MSEREQGEDELTQDRQDQGGKKEEKESGSTDSGSGSAAPGNDDGA